MAGIESQTVQQVLVRKLADKGLPLERATIRVDDLRARKSKIGVVDERLWRTPASQYPEWYVTALAVQARYPLWPHAPRPEKIRARGARQCSAGLS